MPSAHARLQALDPRLLAFTASRHRLDELLYADAQQLFDERLLRLDHLLLYEGVERTGRLALAAVTSRATN